MSTPKKRKAATTTDAAFQTTQPPANDTRVAQILSTMDLLGCSYDAAVVEVMTACRPQTTTTHPRYHQAAGARFGRV